MKKILGFVIVLCFSLSHQSKAQQSVQWTQYILNQYAINPAYAGLDRSLSISAGIRSQWSQFPGAPKTQIINGHLPLYFLSGAGGFTILNDELGAFKRTSATVSYNFVLDSPIGLISGGLRIGGQQITLNNEALQTPDGFYDDNFIDHNDPRLLNANLSGFAPIWSLGAFYAGESLELGITLDNLGNTNEAGNSTFSEKAVVSLFGSYQFPVTDVIALEPNLLVRSDGTQTQLDVGTLAYYNQFIGGISLRGYNVNTVDAVGVLAGIRVSDNVRVSYSFDVGLSGLRRYHDGTHEFLVNYNLNKPIRTGELPRIIYNPRYN